MRIKVEVEGEEGKGEQSREEQSREEQSTEEKKEGKELHSQKKDEAKKMDREIKRGGEEILGLGDETKNKLNQRELHLQRKENFDLKNSEEEKLRENERKEEEKKSGEEKQEEEKKEKEEKKFDEKQKADINRELEKYRSEVERYKQEVEKYKKEVEKYKEEAEEYRKKWLYTFSDFENYRKRVKVDIENAVKDAMVKVFNNMLSAIDSIDSAINFIKDEKVKEGVKLISKIIEDALAKSGVEVIEVREGEKFSPDKCEVVGYEEITKDDMEDGTIVKVLRRGFKFSDRVIRPAQVIVAKGKQTDKRRQEKKEKI